MSTIKELSKTEIEITIEAGQKELKHAKEAVLKELQPDVSAPGFRKGKAPLPVVEKQTDDAFLQSQVIDHALNDAFSEAIKEHKLRPVGQPKVDMKAFVPYSSMTAQFTFAVVPEIKLPDYKKLKVKRDSISVSKDDIEEVVDNLRKRMAEKEEVKRAAKLEDEVIMDFDGFDKDGKAVSGASGKDYSLTLGSDTFIPGFEDELIGLKAGDNKTFDIRFPKDYAHKPLANEVVTFKVTVKTINSQKLPKKDDSLAEKVGPFKKLDELRKDIEKQLQAQKEQEATQLYRDKLIETIADKTKFDLPKVLVDEQVESQMIDFKQNLVYRGVTLEEYLEQAGMKEDEYKEKEILPAAERRVKAGLILSEVADTEKIVVTPEELEIRMQLMKGQYASDQAMQTQLDTPEARRNVMSQLMTEKTLARLEEYAS